MKKTLFYTLLCTTIIATNPALSADDEAKNKGAQPKSAIPSRLMATSSTPHTPTRAAQDEGERRKEELRQAKLSTPTLKDQQKKKLTEMGFSDQHAEQFVDPLLQRARVERDAQLEEALSQVDQETDQKVLARALQKEQIKRQQDRQEVAELLSDIQQKSSTEVGSLQQQLLALEQKVSELQAQEIELTAQFELDKKALEEQARTQNMVFNVYQQSLTALNVQYKESMEEKARLKENVRKLATQLEREKLEKESAELARDSRDIALKQLSGSGSIAVTTPQIPSSVHVPIVPSDPVNTSGASAAVLQPSTGVGSQASTSTIDKTDEEAVVFDTAL